ncbi:MAG: hypothetical protein LBT44_06850 [Clostridiales bacterium]|nr:hypothetical protein [Clostridiales bacterium]
MRARKLIAGVSAAVLAAALLGAGTYAWFSFGQEAKNEFSGEGSNPGGRLHDDFDGHLNKDVYVENFGNRPLFVRVQLNEYMEVSDQPLVQGAAKDDLSTWIPHTPDVDVEICDQVFHAYWDWKLSGNDGERYYLPTSDTDQNSTAPDLGEHFWTAEDAAGNPNLKPVPASEVIFMRDWTEDMIGPYWVFDEDGWAYWAEPLEPDSVTGLLLHQVKQIQETDSNFYYAIDVILQIATLDDIDLIGQEGGIFPGGQRLLEVISVENAAITPTP